MNSTVRLWFAAAISGAVSASLALTGTSVAAPPPTTRAEVVAPVEGGDPLGAEAVGVARSFVRAHAEEYGLSSADVKQLKVSSVVPTSHNGLTNVYLQQRVNHLEITGAILNVAVSSKGKVLRVASTAVWGAGKLANSPTPKISDVRAAQQAAQALGLEPDGSFASDDDATGPDRSRSLRKAGISHDRISVRLVYQEVKRGDLRLAWELVINQLDGLHWWQIRMDAATGAELGRNDWVAEDSHRVYPLPTEAPSFGPRELVADPATSASPFGWNDTNGVPGAESTVTSGNNVHAYTDLDSNNVPDPGSSPDGGPGLVFDFPLDLTQEPSTYRPAAVSQMYYSNNRIHDVLYRYGFDEAAGNFQVNNYGGGGAGGDAVNAEVQDGGGSNNGNFAHPPGRVQPPDADVRVQPHHPPSRPRPRQRLHPPRVRARPLQPAHGRPGQRQLPVELGAGGRGLERLPVLHADHARRHRAAGRTWHFHLRSRTGPRRPWVANQEVQHRHGDDQQPHLRLDQGGDLPALRRGGVGHDAVGPDVRPDRRARLRCRHGQRHGGQQHLAPARHRRPEAAAVQPGIRRRPGCDPGRRRHRLRGRQPVPDLEDLRTSRSGLQRAPGLAEQSDRRYPGFRPALDLQRCGRDHDRDAESGRAGPGADLRADRGEHVPGPGRGDRGRGDQRARRARLLRPRVCRLRRELPPRDGTPSPSPSGTCRRALPGTAVQGRWSRT